jgi:hypothetical protein
MPFEDARAVIISQRTELDHDGTQVVFLEDPLGRGFLGIAGVDGEGKLHWFAELSGAISDLDSEGELHEIQVPEGGHIQKKIPR